MAEGFLLGPGLLARTRRAVETVEGMPIGSGFRDSQVLLEGESPVASKVFRIATFSGAWAIGATKTVTFKYQTTTPNTAVATNLVVGLNPGTVQCDISVAREGTAWFLVQPNLAQQPGYSTTGTQVLTLTSGTLRWIGTTAC